MMGTKNEKSDAFVVVEMLQVYVHRNNKYRVFYTGSHTEYTYYIDIYLVSWEESNQHSIILA